MTEKTQTIRFPMGKTVMTRGVNDLIAENEAFVQFVLQNLVRHARGDWGNVDAEDKAANDLALIEGDRLVSIYEQEGLPKIWIITEADRSVTTVLFPEEY